MIAIGQSKLYGVTPSKSESSNRYDGYIEKMKWRFENGLQSHSVGAGR
jgi:hypothetical protein